MPDFSIASDLKSRKIDRLLKKSIHKFLDSDYLSNHQHFGQKLLGNIIVCRFIQDILFHSQRVDGASAHCRKTVTAIMMQYKNTKALIYTTDCDTDIFDNVGGVLPGVTLVSTIFIICLDYI